MLRKKLLAGLAIALFLFGMVGGANAALTDGPYTSTVIPLTFTDWAAGDQSISFTPFDTSLGTLVSVTLNLFASTQTKFTLTNDGLTPSVGSVFTMIGMSVGNPELAALVITTPVYNYVLAAGQSLTTAKINATGTYTGIYTSGLSIFNGPAPVELEATTLTSTWLANTGGNTTASQQSKASLYGDITYTYIPSSETPIPAAAWLLGSGLIGLVGIRRRFKK